MAAYTAVVSLMNTVQQILNHPRLSISFNNQHIRSILETVVFLEVFMESHPRGGEVLESQIASAAYAAEDVIESHVADQILAGSNEIRSQFFLDLQKVREQMDAIREKVMKVMEEPGFKDLQPYSTPAISSRPLATTMVGFDNYLIQLMDTLTGQQSMRKVVPIVGMGGIGKTTLARNAFENLLIRQFFDLRAWVTVSQNYNVREILLELLSGLDKSESLIALDQYQLGERLYKYLWGRRYLVILDDVWGIDVWDSIKFFFPDNDNGSCIIVTTRLLEVAIHLGSSYLTINFLDEDKSWMLFCEKAFGQEGCPTELEAAGMQISKNCKGLPLSIVVIGGFLQKSSKSQEYWENVAKDTNSILNLEGEEQCLNLLLLSYSHLPAHLKPCYLYLGVFPEDTEIRVSQLIRLWISEGFLKPNAAQSLEEIAEGYLKDLVDRNLVLVCSWGSNGKIKSCNIHDLLKTLCIRVAKKEKFFCVMNSLYSPQALKFMHVMHFLFPAEIYISQQLLYIMNLIDPPRDLNMERRIVIDESIPKETHHKVFRELRSAKLARSLICEGHPPFAFKLLRVLLDAVDEEFNSGFLEADFQCVNLRGLDRRYIGFRYSQRFASRGSPSHSQYLIPPEISMLWNLQTLSMRGRSVLFVAPNEIWEMQHLRHIDVDTLSLSDPDPPLTDTADQQADVVLQNLQTLKRAWNFKLSEEVCKRIPNIKKLGMAYVDLPAEREASSYYCSHNLGRFHKLESLNFQFYESPCWRDLLIKATFPSSLKKLSLYQSRLHWKDLSIIGSLPHLEVLKLDCDAVIGSEWNPVEGEFLRLKFLSIRASYLGIWNADNSHFPVLEKLVLMQMTRLYEIPSGLGDIPTLRCIRLKYCHPSCAISALKILVEQESSGYEGLLLEVQFNILNNKFLKMVEEEGITLTSKNFHLVYGYV